MCLYPIHFARVGTIALIGLAIAFCNLPPALAQPPTRGNPDSIMPSRFLMGDEGFTEPFETIAVAAAEAGIVGRVHVKLGDRVQPGQLLMEMNTDVLHASREIAVAKQNSTARVRAAEFEYQSKQKRFEKLVNLLKDRAGTPEEVERAKAEANVAFERVQELKEEVNISALEVRRLDAQIERHRVRSPIEGVVVEIKKKLGEHVSSGDPQIVTIVRLDILRVVFHLPTELALQMKKGARVDLLLMETDQTAAARVDYIAPVTSADSGRVRMDVLIDNPAGDYRSGIRAQILNNALRPVSALHWKHDRKRDGIQK